MPNSFLGGIALIPSDACIENIIAFQSSISFPFESFPLRHENSHLPHVSIMQFPFSSKNFEKNFTEVCSFIDNFIVSNYKATPITGIMEGLCVKEPSWLFAKVFSPDFQTMHDAFMANLWILLVNFYAIKFGTDTSSYSRNERDSFLRYGYRYARSAFQPHFTLGKVELASVPTSYKGSLKLSEHDFSKVLETNLNLPLCNDSLYGSLVSFSKIVLYKADDNGSIIEVLHEFSLPPTQEQAQVILS